MTAEEMWEQFRDNVLNTGVHTVSPDQMDVLRVAFLSGLTNGINVAEKMIAENQPAVLLALEVELIAFCVEQLKRSPGVDDAEQAE